MYGKSIKAKTSKGVTIEIRVVDNHMDRGDEMVARLNGVELATVFSRDSSGAIASLISKAEAAIEKYGLEAAE